MNFTDALNAVFRDNDRITRVTWHNRSIFVALEEGLLCLKGNPDDGKFHPWTISEQDFFASDWEVVTDA